jgi:hypothetical protein
MSRSHNDVERPRAGRARGRPGPRDGRSSTRGSRRRALRPTRATCGASGSSSRRERRCSPARSVAARCEIPAGVVSDGTRNVKVPAEPWHSKAERRLVVKCPFCANAESRVTDTRASAQGDVDAPPPRVRGVRAPVHDVRARRGGDARSWSRRTARREAFDRQKLLGGLRRACEKRPVPARERSRRWPTGSSASSMDSGEKEVTFARARRSR